MDDLLKAMGKRIHDRRKQLHMTQEKLSELANITPQTVSTAELGLKLSSGSAPLSISARIIFCWVKSQRENNHFSLPGYLN